MKPARALSCITLDALSEKCRKGAVPGLATHSGKLGRGDIFVVLPPSQPGEKGGLDYLADVLEKAPAALVCAQSDREKIESFIVDATAGRQFPALCVIPDARLALGVLAGAFYGTENYRPLLIGVTGTNGKTTSTYLLEALLAELGRKVGVLGTIAYRFPGFSQDAPLTTPDCLWLHSLFADMQKAGVDTVVMEVSSHALDQQRIAGLTFCAALLTNVTQDHLDYHRSMENYFQAKSRLFRGDIPDAVPDAGKAYAININDPYGLRLFRECAAKDDGVRTDAKARGIGFGMLTGGNETGLSGILSQNILWGEMLGISTKGLHLRQYWGKKTWELQSPLVGAFNAMNLLGVQAVALALGQKPEKALRLDVRDLTLLQNCPGVPGRLERMGGADVFVDYAHTPDALTKAIKALRDAGFKRVITLFGCGGDRDKSKRPLMGEVVSSYADVAVLTSDNPRTEDPQAIMDDVLPGMRGCKEFYQEVDRKKATALALHLLTPGSALLVAGKGHENYQIIGTQKNPYSDREVLQELLGLSGV